MKSKLFSLTFILFLFFTATSQSQEIKAPAFGKGILNFVGKDSTWSIKFGARMQFLTSASWEKGPEGGLINPSSNMLIRRARLKFDGFAVSPKLKYKIELGLSNRDMAGQSEFTRNAPRTILDAVIKWNFYRNFVLWAGQTKLPGNVERVVSSGNLQFIDRSILNSRFVVGVTAARNICFGAWVSCRSGFQCDGVTSIEQFHERSQRISLQRV